MSKASDHVMTSLVPHGPNDSNECHQQSDTIGKVSSGIKFAPDDIGWSESRQVLCFSVGARGDENDYDTQGDDVER